jgi:hypothetical protein
VFGTIQLRFPDSFHIWKKVCGIFWEDGGGGKSGKLSPDLSFHFWKLSPDLEREGGMPGD